MHIHPFRDPHSVPKHKRKHNARSTGALATHLRAGGRGALLCTRRERITQRPRRTTTVLCFEDFAKKLEFIYIPEIVMLLKFNLQRTEYVGIVGELVT
ncbi:hypothetical protein EVAR_48184_1 [Eumeta japonica]|uniref:Uncharacterized protein n=1 Tax=Eumeta variegata TaxID=151549 RepID=A0A4C1XX23_EUMVA|nr:hypothetical protein EVAR_48184_1 [Eumeta japonica]